MGEQLCGCPPALRMMQSQITSNRLGVRLHDADVIRYQQFHIG